MGHQAQDSQILDDSTPQRGGLLCAGVVQRLQHLHVSTRHAALRPARRLNAQQPAMLRGKGSCQQPAVMVLTCTGPFMSVNAAAGKAMEPATATRQAWSSSLGTLASGSTLPDYVLVFSPGLTLCATRKAAVGVSSRGGKSGASAVTSCRCEESLPAAAV